MRKLLIEVQAADDRALAVALDSLSVTAAREGLRKGYALDSADTADRSGDWKWCVVKESR